MYASNFTVPDRRQFLYNMIRQDALMSYKNYKYGLNPNTREDDIT